MTRIFPSMLLLAAMVSTVVAADIDFDADSTTAGDLPAYRIVTPTATYVLEKTGAGLSSIIDRDGHDWLSFDPQPDSRAAGEYRGFPNAVHQQAGNYFHPKNKATDPATTTVLYAGPDRVTITAVSQNSLWESRYDFLPSHCTFTMSRMPRDKRYWILYEGTPGGQYDDSDWWFTSAQDLRQPLTTPHEGDIPAPEWIAFGDERLNRVLYLLHHTDDDKPDCFYQMNRQMTVFGFGRRDIEKYLEKVPDSFTIGFLETTNHADVNRAMRNQLQLRSQNKIPCASVALAQGESDPTSERKSSATGNPPESHGATAFVENMHVRVSWGHRAPAAQDRSVRFEGANLDVNDVRALDTEVGDTLTTNVFQTRAGGGDVDGADLRLSFEDLAVQNVESVHSTWAYLLEHGDAGATRRLKQDPAYRPDPRKLTIRLNDSGTRGFSLTVDQLRAHRAFWLPESDVFVSVGDNPINFDEHLASLAGQRVLDRVAEGPEATRSEWTGRWADFGDPNQPNAGHETNWLGSQGHLTGLIARHGSLYKFGVDRWGRVRPDFASPHKFRFDPLWESAGWNGQRIIDGLPILVTEVSDGDQQYRVEQFAAPLRSGLPERRGEVASVVCTTVRHRGPGPFHMSFRLATERKDRHPQLRELDGRWCVVDRETDAVWLMIEPERTLTVRTRAVADGDDPHVIFDCVGSAAGNAQRAVVIKLASPVVTAEDVEQLAELDVAKVRAEVVAYWEDWLARGAHFEVPEQVVNDLFRANLWHALLLPRHRTDEQGVDRIDLPYSNFAYGQLNADWPINQAVYVDYMLHGLRGYFDVADEELAAMYRSQQQPNGRVGGYADWGVYSPAMLYTVGQNFLLSGDRAGFERQLPASLRAADWCLGEIAKGQDHREAPGLIVAPLNDLTHDARAWAFPNAYFVAGLELFAHALNEYGHSRAGEIRDAARQMRADVERAFARASVQSAAVQLADGTWSNYVPCDAMTPRRLLDVWYPTDVDCGVVHLARLRAIDAGGWLTTAMLHDHEDNLYLNQWGMANEPVYNQQGTAYLLRDEPKAAIRAFYSMMACAFSHHQLTPLEHRWAWGQYYMPPSTDGAWFELYRKMLVHEWGGEQLLLLQATPRQWLEDGKQIRIERAPTWYGVLDLQVASRADRGEILATVRLTPRKKPAALLLRLRHPHGKPIRTVLVNGQAWNDFDVEQEWVRIPAPSVDRYEIVVRY